MIKVYYNTQIDNFVCIKYCGVGKWELCFPIFDHMENMYFKEYKFKTNPNLIMNQFNIDLGEL